MAAVSPDKEPFSDEAETCLVAGGVRPRNGRAYDFRKVVRRGSEDRDESFESYSASSANSTQNNSVTVLTRSLSALIIHSPPLRPGASRMIPTSASSAHTRSTGLCLCTRAASSFSLCSGAILASVALDAGASATARWPMSAGVNVFGKRL